MRQPSTYLKTSFILRDDYQHFSLGHFMFSSFQVEDEKSDASLILSYFQSNLFFMPRRLENILIIPRVQEYFQEIAYDFMFNFVSFFKLQSQCYFQISQIFLIFCLPPFHLLCFFFSFLWNPIICLLGNTNMSTKSVIFSLRVSSSFYFCCGIHIISSIWTSRLPVLISLISLSIYLPNFKLRNHDLFACLR